jgi:hypothetical protein
MRLTIRRTGLLNTAYLPDSLKPRKGKTLVVHIESLAWSDPPAHPDYTVLRCTGLGRRWAVEARHALQALAVEGFKELLFVVDALRKESSLRAKSSEMWRMPAMLLLIPKKVKIADIPPELAHMLLGKPEDDK